MSSASSRQSRASRSLSPPKSKEESTERDQHTCDRCRKKGRKEDDRQSTQPSMTDKSQQTRISHEKPQEHQPWRHASNARRPSSRQSCLPADSATRTTRQANIVCTKHEKEKVKMQTTIEKLQEAFCDKESKFQDTKSQLVRERRMSEIMERQLKNARNLSEQLGRIIHDREQEIRTLKNLLNKRQDSKNLSEAAVQAAMIKAARTDRRRSTSKDDFQASMRRSSSTSDHTDCPSLSSASVDKMLKEVHSLIDGLKIKDEAIKGLQEECTRRLDKIQILQRSIQVLQDQMTQSTQHHNSVCQEKDNMITQLQHSLKESEETVQSLLSEKTKVVIEGENTIQELQEIIQQKDLMIKRIQCQLEEALDTKETELQQLRDTLDLRQKDLDSKQRDLEECNEELFRSQMESESLKFELNQEKCSLNKMSEEINSLVDKLTTAVEEMEATKLEYHKKDERLKHTQKKIQEMYMLFLSDQDVTEKLKDLYRTRREYTGRRVLSEEDVLEKTLLLHGRPRHLRNENKGKFGSSGVTNQQIHKQQLAELQQQVNDSQAVCSILQEQLKEVTDFLDQLLHIDISPKNLPALSLIKHYGKHLRAPSNILSKERIAPDGVSSNSQLDMEFSRQGTLDGDDINQMSLNGNCSFDTDMPVRPGSYEDVNFYDQECREYFVNHKSVSAENLKESNHFSAVDPPQQRDTSDVLPISVSIQGASSDSDEIILLLNDREVTQGNNTSSDATKGRKMSRPAVVSPPFPRGLKITENYGSDGSINTRENSSNVIERSVSFGSFSDSVLMSYEQSERGASDESSGMVNNRCVRSIDMMDLIPVGNIEMKGGVFLSSDSDIWSEPDTNISRQRMGFGVEETTLSSDYSTTYVSDELHKRKICPQSRCESRRSKQHVIHVPTKKTANKVKRWLEKLKNYLRMFEEANFHLTDEINNLCDVRNQMSSILSTEEKVENSESILDDLAEYIRLNFLMQKKLEKSIHFNRQLIDVFQRNISCQKKPILENNLLIKQTPAKHSIKHRRHSNKRIAPSPYVEEINIVNQIKTYEDPDIHSQLVGYHATLMSCQDMIKDLHSQLKDRHCNEIMNKHELNRTVYGYLEDIDHCIDDLCKKMETSTGESPTQSYSFKSAFSNNVVGTESPEEHVYENHEVFSPNPLMDKIKENEDRLLRFEVLLNDKEQQLKLSAENALQLEEQLSGIKQSLYEIQMENLELKECLELSENKQLEMEDSSNQMLRELQMTMQRLADLEERFRCLNDEHLVPKNTDKTLYPVQYNFHNGDTWEDSGNTTNIPSKRGSYERDWESEDY